jgi:serralysin
MGTFHFLGTAAFDGSTFALDYVYNSTTGITTVLGDINGDKVADFAIDLTGNIALNVGNFVGVQAAPVVIESFGSTSLVQVGNYYYFYPVNGSSGPQFKYNGSPVSVGQYPSLTFIAAEQTASGYEVAIKIQGADQYTVWNTDNNGNFVSNGTGGVFVSGSSSVLESLEPSFHQDLNGDGVIGAPAPAATVIESFGSTSLVQVGSNFYFYPVGGSSGPEFKYKGVPVVAGANEWSYIGVEQTASGYAVALKIAGTDQYTIWNTDSNGNFVSNGTGGVIVSGQSSVFRPYETVFQQDLNGDGVISVSAPVLSGSANGDNFVFRTDLLLAHTDATSAGPSGSYDTSGAAVHTQVQAFASGEAAMYSYPAGATPDAPAEGHLADLHFGHFIIQ